LAGNQLEAAVGRWKFLAIYFISGIGASLISAIYFMLNNEPVLSAGASGAIYGIIGALAAVMIRSRRGLNSLIGAQFFVLIAFIIFDGTSRANIDVVAHLAGFGFGLVMAFILYKSKLNIYKVSCK